MSTITKPRPVTPTRPGRPRRRRHGGTRGNGAATLVLFAGALVAGLVAVTLLARPTTGSLERTGETNTMGMPVYTTPGEASGRASAGGVEVTGARWALGTVPLNVSVQPSWLLRNTSGSEVTLGEPHAEVVEGCCPGPLTLTSRSLVPGGTATLTFDLSMHEGMDGWHDMNVHVPIDGDDETLTVKVTGDFRS